MSRVRTALIGQAAYRTAENAALTESADRRREGERPAEPVLALREGSAGASPSRGRRRRQS
jgi:hypothetical protein